MIKKFVQYEFSIKSIDLPGVNDKDAILYWLLYSMGVVNERDKKGIKATLLITLMRHKKELSADELSHLCKISRTNAIFHLKELVKKGLIEYNENKYRIAANSYEELIRKLKLQLNKTLDNMIAISKLIQQ